MDRKEFIQLAGANAAWMLISACFASCSEDNSFPAPPTNLDITLDVSSGALSQNGGSVLKSGVVVARTLSGTFLAVSAACTHQGTNVEYQPGSHRFFCPAHGSVFSESGAVTNGPASIPLHQYKTILTGTTLKVSS